ncbi:beta strand repeat-containing protein [Flavobacterium dankookense]|uniref:Uncharacterized protein n=1 Tax=Flavobacterium dankookense TaxID=706186 RepID=A0A4R6QAM2_9FLAO|nr:hypothetical protein [Flavobacterium dankookense]TDP59167.1 hypothetical protein BC748_1409 [Flavobacterium dankookense]
MKLKNYSFILSFIILAAIENGYSQSGNTFSGEEAGTNSTGNYNTGFGLFSLHDNANNSNTAFGANTLPSNRGGFNSAFGNDALKRNIDGQLNSAFGTRSLENNLTGTGNVAVGFRALGNSNITGSNNTAIGYASLLINEGNSNVALGQYSGWNLVSGNGNVIIGTDSGKFLQNGNQNVFLGKVVLENQPSTSLLVGNDASRIITIADGAGNQRILVNNNGNVGIGLGNNVRPLNRLDVNGGVVIGKNYMPNIADTPDVIAPANGLLVQGNVGVGTTLPKNKLEITHGTDGKSGLRFTNLTSNSALDNNTATDKFLTVNANGDVVLQKTATSALIGTLTTNNNTITSNVNGSISNASIINSVTNTINSNNQLVTTINGVTSTPITFPSFTDTDAQSLSLVGNTLSISNGNSVVLPNFNEVDGSTTNELQTLSQAGNIITLSNGGGSFQLPTLTDTDAQSLSLTGNTLSISNGNSVVLPNFNEVDGSTTNELQTLSQAGNTITLSNGGGSFQLPTLTDTDAQSLSLTGNVLAISNGNSVTLPVPVFTGNGNITITGNGSTATPYLINSIDTSIYTNNGSINQLSTTNGNRVVDMNSRNIWFNTANSPTNGKIYLGSTANYPSSTGNYKLFVEGGILTEKVKVALRSTANWADYVFADDYKLMPLADVEKFISKNNHLPGIKSASELAENGLDVAEMQAKQMEKIEELTLYAIEQDKKIKEQNQLISKFNTELEELKNQVKALIEKTK